MSAAIYLEDTWEACKISFIRGDTVHYSPATGQSDSKQGRQDSNNTNP